MDPNDKKNIKNFWKGQKLMLFDLNNDPEERNNIEGKKPDLAQQLLEKIIDHSTNNPEDSFNKEEPCMFQEV